MANFLFVILPTTISAVPDKKPLRSKRLREIGKMAFAAVVAWLLMNAPVFLASPSGWLYFWQFNIDRGADLGSIWYVLSLAGLAVYTVFAGLFCWFAYRLFMKLRTGFADVL